MDGQYSDIGLGVSKSIITDAPSDVCPKCGCKHFRNVFILKKLSKIQLGLPEDVIYPVSIFVCDKCGEIAPSVLEDEDMKKIIGEKKIIIQ